MNLPGLDLDVPDIDLIIDGIASQHEALELVRSDPTINTAGDSCRIHNGYFATPDADCYAGIVASRSPTSIVEVGAGYSSRIAAATCHSMSADTTLTVIDPEPRTDPGAGIELIARAVEDLDPRELTERLGPNSILFIDSSHRAVDSGDIEFLFLEIIPSLPKGCWVHVDDIYLPYGYPGEYRARDWNEQIVLAALLSSSQRYRVVLPMHHLARTRPELLRRFSFIDEAWSGHSPGSSFWFEVARAGC